MTELILRKIDHRGAPRIALYFARDASLLRALRQKLDLRFSRTWSCWYCDYLRANYRQLERFADQCHLVVEKEDGTRFQVQTAGADVKGRRDLLPIGLQQEAARPCLSASGGKQTVHKSPDQGKTAQTVAWKLLPPVGKYWVLQVPYREKLVRELKQIKGVGPKLEKLLHSMGFYHFDQIAAWTEDEVAWVDENLPGFKGRVSRDDWVAQAKTLASEG